MSWILRLEDQRVLHDPAPPIPPASSEASTPAMAGRNRKAPAVVVPPPPPDLVRLLSDGEARVRRRAALAVGRVGLARRRGAASSRCSCTDADPEVRQMAAFALGLLGDRRQCARSASWRRARGSRCRSPRGAPPKWPLGLIGDASAADAVSKMVSKVVQSGALAQAPAPGDDADTADDAGRRDTASGAFRLGVFALVRLKAYDAFAAAVLDASGLPRVHAWPVAFALQRFEDKRGLPGTLLIALVRGSRSLHAGAFAVKKGLGEARDPRCAARCRAIMPLHLDQRLQPTAPVLIEAIPRARPLSA